MPLIANLTLTQLRAATKAQIITGITNYLTNNFTKRQLIVFLLDRDREPDAPVTTRRADGQVSSQTDVERDVETGVMTGGRVVTYSYYPTGEVMDIVVSTRDAANKEIAKKVIKHFTDERQPEVT